MSQNNTRTPQSTSRSSMIVAIVLSILLAFGLWLYVVVEESPTGQRTFSSVPVKLVGTDTLSSTYGFSVLSGYDTTVEVTLRGRQSELNALSEEDISAKVDLSDITAAGSYTRKIQVTPPSGTEVVATSPTEQVVEVDVAKTVSVPVLEPEETYTLAEGIRFKRTYSAENISVKGPQTVVDKIYGVKCLVDLGEFTENVVKTVELRFVDKEGNEITDRYLVPSQNTLTITYTLYKEKTVPLVLNVVPLLEGEQVTQSVTPSSITVQGAPEVVDSLEEIEVKTITTAELPSTQSHFSGTVPTIDGITYSEGTVNYTAEVYLSGSSVVRRTLDLESDEVTVTPPEGFTYTFSATTVGVNVRTDAAHYAEVDNARLTASVNLSPFRAVGTYPVNITVSVKAEDSDICYVIGTVTTTVTLSK